MGTSKLAKSLISSAFWASAAGILTGCTVPTAVLTTEEQQQAEALFVTLRTIRKDYINPEKIGDNKKLLGAALRTVLNDLDPHSDYEDENETESYGQRTSGEPEGVIGVTLGDDDGTINIVSVDADTPAHLAGLKAGDVILKINDARTSAMNTADALKLIRGIPDQVVHLTIKRSGIEQPMEFTIKRQSVPEPENITTEVWGPGVGYIKISSFSRKDMFESQVDGKIQPGAFRNAIEKLKYQMQPYELKHLALDLRDNPGGFIDSGLAVAGNLVGKNKVLMTERGQGGVEINSYLSASEQITDAELLILANERSASASELVMAALQDHKRGKVLAATPSFGKGSVQTRKHLEFMDNMPEHHALGGAIKLTTALYFAPSGRSVQGKGITPDILIKLPEATYTHDHGENQLSNSIKVKGARPDQTRTTEICSPALTVPPQAALVKKFTDANQKNDYSKQCAYEYFLRSPAYTTLSQTSPTVAP